MNDEIAVNTPSPREQLITYLLDRGVSETAVSVFVIDFEVPDNLKFLRSAARLLVKILTEFAPIEYSPSQPLVSALKISKLISEISALPEAPAFLEEADSQRSLRGLIENHPFYALILSNSQNTVRINHFLGHFLPCYVTWRDTCATQAYLNINACREARRLIWPFALVDQESGTRSRTPLKTLAHFVTLLPACQTSQATYRMEFEKHFASIKKYTPLPIELLAVETILAVFRGDAPEQRAPTNRQPPTPPKKKQTGGKYVQRNLLPGSELQTITTTESGEHDDDSDDGGDPDESSTTTYTFQKLKPKTPVFSTEDDRYLLMANQNRSAVYARANQALHLSTDNLNAFDIEQLCAALRSASLTIEPDKELLAFLSLQMVSGQPSSQLIDAVLHSGKSLTNTNTLGYSKSGTIIFRPWSGQANDLENRQSTPPISRELRIQIPQAAHEIVAEWLAVIKPKSGEKVFTSEPTQLLKRASNFLSSMNDELGTRLSLTRLEAFLYRSLCQLPAADPSIAILLSGQTTNFGHSPAFYNGWQLDQLQDFYRSHLEFLDDWTAISVDWRDGHLIVDENAEDMAGSRFVPTEEAIGSYAQELRKTMRSASHNPPRQTPVIAKHNLYIAALYSYLSFLLGSRAVSHLLLHPDCINLDLRVIYLSDKDDSRYRHGRLCPLPDFAMHAFQDLEDHLNALASPLMLINPESALQIAHGAYPPPTGNRQIDLEKIQNNPPLLFFLSVDGEIEPLRPGTCMQMWIDISKLKMNSPRHAFRTGARAAGSADAIVRSVMGHWQTGTESLGRFSTLRPQKVRGFAEGWMSQHMRIENKQRWHPPISPLLK